ncbi:MAG: hypothetical protein IMW89_18520 [Ktedonobacteraceae bacterium]|nr:hypothetical protein [Ktedonobacteraceae bacterium]
MNNQVAALLKAVVLVGGAVAGALLARWVDDLLTSRAQERSAYDKKRYEQGLSPRVQENGRTNTIYTVDHILTSDDVRSAEDL